ncbi:hypothetical protein JCM11641_000286 [Rhodosporidiobolus odoratus]
MPLKRKAAPAAKEEPAAKKRSTRSSGADTASATTTKKTTTKAKASSTKSTSSKWKGKKKATEEIVLGSSDVEGSDNDVVVEDAPKKKKPAAPKKNETKTPAKQSKAAQAAYSPVEEKTTSTPRDVAPAKKSPKKPAKKVPFEQAFPAWFASFAEEDNPSKMGGEGIEKLFEDMDLSMEGAHPFILAWKVKSPPGSFGSFNKRDFELAIDSSDKLKDELLLLEKTLYAPSSASTTASSDGGVEDSLFKSFYSFLFPFLKNEGAKSLPPDMAIAVLTVALAPKFELAKAFVEFAESQGDKFRAMGVDAWTQLYDFCKTVKPDLEGWSEYDAWPSIIDAFVEWKKEKGAASA